MLEADGLAAAAKRFLLGRSCVTDREQHRVADILRLTELLGIPATPKSFVLPAQRAPALAPAQSYAVVHAAPMFTYKRWSAGGWRKLAARFARARPRHRGHRRAIGSGLSRRGLARSGDHGSDVVRLDGKLEWPELSALIGAARAYIGPDTAVTHLAAATGAPTVALYGPTDPRIWGPWPRGGLDRPWAPSGTIQRRGNVWLVQNPLLCLPCQQEGCDRRLDSRSQCLDELTVNQVVSAVDQALTMRQAA